MTWKDIIKAPPLTPEQEKEVQEEMRFRNLERPDAEKRIRRKNKKTGQRKQATYEDWMRNKKAEDLGDTMDRRERSMTDKDKLLRAVYRIKDDLEDLHDDGKYLGRRDYFEKLLKNISGYNEDNRHYDGKMILKFFDDLAGLEHDAEDVRNEIIKVAEYIKDYAPEGE